MQPTEKEAVRKRNNDRGNQEGGEGTRIHSTDVSLPVSRWYVRYVTIRNGLF